VEYVVPPHLLYFFYEQSTSITQEQLEEWASVQDDLKPVMELLQHTELIQPVFFERQLTCLLLLGGKLDGSPYSSEEQEFLYQLSFILGPYLQNANLLQGLEEKIAERTEALKQALQETQAREQEVARLFTLQQEQKQQLEEQDRLFQIELDIASGIHLRRRLHEQLGPAEDGIHRSPRQSGADFFRIRGAGIVGAAADRAHHRPRFLSAGRRHERRQQSQTCSHDEVSSHGASIVPED
jgi:hypothetical protein